MLFNKFGYIVNIMLLSYNNNILNIIFWNYYKNINKLFGLNIYFKNNLNKFVIFKFYNWKLREEFYTLFIWFTHQKLLFIDYNDNTEMPNGLFYGLNMDKPYHSRFFSKLGGSEFVKKRCFRHNFRP